MILLLTLEMWQRLTLSQTLMISVILISILSQHPLPVNLKLKFNRLFLNKAILLVSKFLWLNLPLLQTTKLSNSKQITSKQMLSVTLLRIFQSLIRMLMKEILRQTLLEKIISIMTLYSRSLKKSLTGTNLKRSLKRNNLVFLVTSLKLK